MLPATRRGSFNWRKCHFTTFRKIRHPTFSQWTPGSSKSFKAHYQKQLVKHYIECAEQQEAQTVNIREALHMVKTAWDSVSSSTIANCYRHVKILDTDSPDINEDNDLPLIELQRLLRQLPGQDGTLSADEYVDIDNEEETGQTLSDEDILDLVQDKDQTTDSDTDADDTSDPVQPEVSLAQAHRGLEDAIAYFEQTTSGEHSEDTLSMLLKVCRDLKDKSIKKWTQKKMTDFFMAQ